MENKKPQYVSPLSLAFYHCMNNLSNKAIRLWIVLKKYKNNKTGLCFPSYDTIMQEGGLNRNQISEGIQELMIVGFIIRIDKKIGSKSGKMRNFYILEENPENISENLKRAKEYLNTLKEKNKTRRSKKTDLFFEEIEDYDNQGEVFYDLENFENDDLEKELEEEEFI